MGDFQQEGAFLAELKRRHVVEMVRWLNAHLGDGFKVTPARAAEGATRVDTRPEVTNAGVAAESIQALRELAQRLDTHCPGQGRSGRLHR